MKNESFGTNLKKFRKQRQMSQGELAKKLDVRQTTISNYENDLRFPNADLLNKIARTLNVSLDDLIMRESNETLEPLDYEKISNAFINKILEHKEKEAKKMIIKFAQQGYDVLTLFDQVLKKSLYTVGEMWAKGKLSIPMEHHISHLVEELVYSLSSFNEAKHDSGKRVLLITPDNEPHTIGIKIIKEYFRRYGWKTVLLQGSVPWKSLVNMIQEKNIDLLCISITMADNINQTKALIDFVRESTQVEIMAGGQLFSRKDYIDFLNPDVFYNDHDDLVDFLEKTIK
jgi:methanogenic corrinoid protein MtbC1